MKRTVLLTGATRGLGYAIKNKFLETGYQVIAPTREELDLSRPESLKTFLQGSGDREIDILINNAGFNRPQRIGDLSLEQFQESQQVNLLAPFQLIQKYSVGMSVRRWGRIINIGSIYSLISRPGRAAYSASKSGLLSLTRTAALELGPYNVLVNCVCPGFIETDMTKQNNTESELKLLRTTAALGRLGTPLEIAEAVFFLASEGNSFMTGQELIVDGGFLAGQSL